MYTSLAVGSQAGNVPKPLLQNVALQGLVYLTVVRRCPRVLPDEALPGVPAPAEQWGQNSGGGTVGAVSAELAARGWSLTSETPHKWVQVGRLAG